ncbi:NAD(P)/FAD-dependent oxidoreductase [Alcanivorax sp. 24]|uniref:NAD(P)/FAD-dependent oxidoreductase n=1 Tax=Alcanivorax sp. 24 TaxID=2545266 RepID=UPI00105F24E4|nr:NAD(P)/FAD-dependent oxidoreductase [Alcanivorax sp. 24]
MDTLGTVIIGGGVVGLAIARELALAGRAPVLLEAETHFGEHLSSRNSEVIHAGLYYPPGSLKAMSCLRGNALLHEYCRRRRIAHRRCGKWVVAKGEEQTRQLRALHDNAIAAGAGGLHWLGRAALEREEPWLAADLALSSERTGIVDSHGLMMALATDAEDAGALLCLRHRVTASSGDRHGFELQVAGPEGDFELRCEQLVIAAGLGSVPLLQRLHGLPAALAPRQGLARGNYFRLRGASPTRRLIYPLPERHGLGVHLTVDLSGQARFGPDVEWIDDVDYRVNRQRESAFENAVRAYWPGLPPASLLPDYTGIRPKLRLGDEPYTDFCLFDAQDHGLPGLIALLGIESPGLTAALALAERIRRY